jgi:hypothetical protein
MRGFSLKRVISILFIVSLLLGGCADNGEKKLIGKWQEINNPMGGLEFRSDHTGNAFWPDESGRQQSSAMKWELIKGESKVSIMTPPGPLIFEIKPDKIIAPNGVALSKVK